MGDKEDKEDKEEKEEKEEKEDKEDKEEDDDDKQDDASKEDSNLGLILGLVGAGALIGGATWFFACRNKNENEGGEKENKKLFKQSIKSKKTQKTAMKESLVPVH